jgi:tRNA (cytidine/uridine-2'-O-)-methyltransferase
VKESGQKEIPQAESLRPGVSDPLFHIVLVRPEIPQNTGSIARLAAATRSRLHLVGPLGFSLEDRYLKRAGLDYWPLVDLCVYQDWKSFAVNQDETTQSPNFKYFSAHAEKTYLQAEFHRDDFLVFGSETKGLGSEFLEPRRQSAYRIPIFERGVRSLNLANAVSIAVYEALRQTGLLADA